jgi:hypothetical protein
LRGRELKPLASTCRNLGETNDAMLSGRLGQAVMRRKLKLLFIVLFVKLFDIISKCAYFLQEVKFIVAFNTQYDKTIW